MDTVTPTGPDLAPEVQTAIRGMFREFARTYHRLPGDTVEDKARVFIDWYLSEHEDTAKAANG